LLISLTRPGQQTAEKATHRSTPGSETLVSVLSFTEAEQKASSTIA
jgi:hypothetical protein